MPPYEKVTVLVPQDRLPEFYVRFGDFMARRETSDLADADARVFHQVGEEPTWARQPGAEDVAGRFWREVTDPGRDLLRVLIDGAERDASSYFSPGDLVVATRAKSTQAVAGTFGGIGRIIAAQNLPTYQYADGKRWHFVWDWDPKKRLYSMSPAMAELLRAADA